MFLHLSVSHSVHGGVSASVDAGIHTPWADTPLGQTPPADTPPGQTAPLLGRHPPPSRGPLQQTVRILLECFLVLIMMFRIKIEIVVNVGSQWP